MLAKRCLVVLTAAFVPTFSTGCIVINAGSWGHHPRAWTDQQTERLSLDAAQLQSLNAWTHNGAITFEAQPAGSTEPHVIVTKRTGGVTLDDAEKAMAALEVFAEPWGNGTKLGYRWRGLKSRSWYAEVSFDIKAAGQLDFSAESHNGPVKAGGIQGNVNVVTHNGSVIVDSEGDRLEAESHNGPINVAFKGDHVSILTHNGEVSADLSRCATVSGDLTTHNGGVDVLVGERLSAKIDCRTHNGRIAYDVPMSAVETSGRRVVGTIGNGEGALEVETHNGSVKVKRSTG